jgi:hypothetical protein
VRIQKPKGADENAKGAVKGADDSG